MLVTRVVGDCPGCGGLKSFGNVDIYGSYIQRGCTQCRYSARVYLPDTKKKILYLDQFFFSSAFRGGDPRFLEAARLIKIAAAAQVLAVPYSSIHVDETHQWERREELFEFVKATSRGHEFEPAYTVERFQLIQSFQSWLAGEPANFKFSRSDVLPRDLDAWDGYFRIDVTRMPDNIELIRELKAQSVAALVDLFPGWRTLKTTFEEDLKAEYLDNGKEYMESYWAYAVRLANEDYDALLDSPIISHVVESLLRYIPEDVPGEQMLPVCWRFFMSDHFKQTPYSWLSAHMFATQKELVKKGMFTNREAALSSHSGYFYDVKHIATYAPYCDAFIMDKFMAELVSRKTVALEAQYGVKVFSLANWDALYDWLNALISSISDEHNAGLVAAYGQPPK